MSQRLTHYWYLIKNGENFYQYNNEVLGKIWLLNYIGILVNLVLFYYIDNIFRYLLLVLSLFYTYRAYFLNKHLKQIKLNISLARIRE